ncbi:MAG: non-ribosomal peptide synthetase [Actinomycetota bacterium]
MDAATDMPSGSAERQALVELLLRQELQAERDRAAIRPRDRPDEPVPLSFAQQRIWFQEQLRPGSTAYNELTAVRLSGPFDRALIEQSVNDLIRRHEALRTSVVIIDGRPAQVVAPQAVVTFAFDDLRSLPEDRREATALQRARDDAERPFDLTVPPLLRMRVEQLDHDDHVLCLTLHHVVSDGWSLGVLLRELMALYVGAQSGRTATLPPLPIQYADYTIWQRRQLDEGVIAPQLEYWRQQLAGAPPTSELPADRPRPRLQSFAGESHTFEIAYDCVQRLAELSRGERATLFMTLLGAFQVLLSRYSGQQDLVVGTPVANRARTETEGVVGCFVNPLPMRADLSDDPTFRELLKQVKSTVLAAFARQEVPFERLVEDVALQRDLSRNPIFQTLFVLHNQPLPVPDLPGLSVSRITGLDRTAKLDVTLSFVETPAGLEGKLEYNTDLFDSATISRMAGHVVTLLASIADNPDRRVSMLQLLSDSELCDVRTAWEAPDVDGADARCLQELFVDQVVRTPAAIAVVHGETRLTYAELNRRANQLAVRLRACGVERGSLVALCLERSLDLVIAVVAVLKAGAAYVPLDPRYPADRIDFILRDTAAVLLLTHDERPVQLEQPLPTRVLSIDSESDGPSGEVPEPSIVNDPRDLAYVIYTSGSTGKPKGVLIEHRNVVRLFTATRQWFGFGEHDVWSLFHSYAFDVSVFEMWGALLHGGRLVVVPYDVTRAPDRFAQLLDDEQVTVLSQTPTAFSELIEADARRAGGAPSLRFVIMAGERLDYARLAAWFVRHPDTSPELVNMYGTTETTVHATYRRVRNHDADSGRSDVGVPIPDLQLLVVDGHLQPVPIGVPGELLIAGAGVGRGYLGRPDLTAERFIADPFGSGRRCYRTGDLVRRTSDGDLEYLRRTDGQIKMRGFRIELGEIEAALRENPAIRDAVVSADLDAPGGGRLLAYVVPAVEPAPPMVDVSAFLRSRLPDYMLPAVLTYVEQLPRTANGKIDRQALPAIAPARPELGVTYAAPSTATETSVAGAWVELLEVQRVGLDDNFFDLGGHSVLAIHLHRMLTDKGMKLEVVDVFQYPTVRSLADRITRGGDDPRALNLARERGARRRTALSGRVPTSSPRGRRR